MSTEILLWVCFGIAGVLIVAGSVLVISAKFQPNENQEATRKRGWGLFGIGLALMAGDVLGLYSQRNAEEQLRGTEKRLVAQAKETEERLRAEAKQEAEEMAAVIVAKSNNLKNLTEAELIVALQPLAGPPEVAQLAARSVLDGGVYHTKCVFDATLSFLEGHADYFAIRATQGMTIHNPGTRSIDFPFGMMLFHLIEPPDISIEATFDELTRRTYAQDGRLLESKIEGPGELQISRTEDTSTLTKKLRIGPGESVEVRIVTTTYEPADHGEIAFITTKKAVGMELSVKFPSAGPEELETQLVFVHSRCDEVNCSKQENGSTVTARIEKGLLPFNGFIVGWDHGKP